MTATTEQPRAREQDRTSYRLVRSLAPGPAPSLDPQQQRVVEHAGGPLLVLAGPGTGKTTTLVEAIARRIEEGARPEQVLALTFSRKAAEQLRDRVTARLGRTMSTTLSSTFHSFAYGLVRRYAPAELYAAPLRLLSAPEQDVVLGELLSEAPESVRWPDHLRAAVGTRGFAREVHAVLSRARERGLDPDQLSGLGRAEGVPEWEAAGLFMEQYLDVLGDQSAIDYADLVVRGVAQAREHQADLRATLRHVFVDEYQDTDPSQVALLRAIAGDGRDLVAVGDPDQSIYGFRGADVRGILDFPRAFPQRDGRPAEVVPLTTTRRFGSRLLRASRAIAAGIGVTGAIPSAAYAAFRAPESVAHDLGPGAVEAHTFDTARAEAEHVADLLRRAHLEDGVPWSEMAVLVRSGRASIPGLRRSLAAAGVPVEVASDETPLVREPAVLPLLGALGVLLDADVADPADEDYVTADRAEALLISPLGGLDATDVRALTRELRRRDPASAPRDLVRAAVLDPARTEALSRMQGLGGDAARRAHRFARLLARARADLDAGTVVEEVLWTIWDGCDWGERLRRATRVGGQAARLAHRDLDAVCALFETAARVEERKGRTSAASFLATLRAQEIPADTLADRGVRGDAVRLLTAHRAKGLEWRLVVVAHVQEGAWPDLRRRDSLLGADRIGPDGVVPPLGRGALLAEERRLFYVACTRPRQRLVVTAVASPDDDGEQPSRFLEELGRPVEHRVGRPRRPLSLAGLVAELRRTVADAEQPEAVREAAARRLHRLATTEVHGRVLAPGADPATWWGLRAPSRSLTPVRRVDEPLVLSASALEGAAHLPGPVLPAAGGRWGGGQLGPAGLRHGRARARRAGRQRRPGPRRRGHPPDAAGRRRVGADAVPHALVGRAGARRGARRALPVPDLARAPGGPHARRDRGADLRRGHAAGRHGRAPARVRRPARARRGRPRGRGRPEDRQVPADEGPGRGAPAARALPAGGGPRRGRRGRRAPGRLRGRRARPPAAPRRGRQRGAEGADPGAGRRRRAAGARPGGRGGRRAARGGVRGPSRPAVPALRLPGAVPRPDLGERALVTSRQPEPRELRTPEELRALMGAEFTVSPQQWEAITAPLEPGVVIAGAGSGKTSVMAARVVWLVATGRVRPEEVLGLTFTTKATAELEHRVRASLRAAGLLPPPGERDRAPGPEGEEPEEAEEPTVATYHAYAASLLADHGLRIGHEPDTRLIADASRYQLAARAVARHTAPVEHLTDSPRHVVQALLALDAEMAEHLVDPTAVRAFDARERPLFVEGAAAEHRKTYRERNEKAVAAIDKRAELLDLVDTYRALKTHHGVMDFSDQIALAARLARECPEVGEAERGRYRVVLLDEYQDTSVAQALMLSGIFSGPDRDRGLGHPVTAVGDPNQAIYGWRGASVSNILEFARSFPTADGTRRVHALTVNRRSDERILATANHLAEDLYASGPDLAPLVAPAGAAPGSVRAVVHETVDEELAWLADEVLAAHGRLAVAAPAPARGAGPDAAAERECWRGIGILTRDNATAAAVFDALAAREIPVEIVGLKGLLRLPEVAEVVATLALVDDVTANASLLTLLTGPRWAVGPRDLALLGRRAEELAGSRRRRGAGAPAADVAEQLAAAVEGADPTEIPALCDALEDPGELGYSPEALERFALLAEELRRLRALAGEPILDLVRRIIDVTGIDVELASSVSPAAAARRDNLDLFVQAVADFQAVDGQVTLPALLAWLEAEDEMGQGLDVAVPSEADSVKLLTVHRAKGLEWDAVFLVGVTERKFPAEQGRPSWLTVPHVLPAPLRGDARDRPTLAGHTPDDIERLRKDARTHEATEELRLAYVAWTRARHALTVSSWCWSPTLRTGRGPSAYLQRTREAMAAWGGEPERWVEAPEKGAPHPYADVSTDLPWPIDHHTDEVARRVEAAKRVRAAAEEPAAEDGVEDVLLLGRIAQWDEEIDRLTAEAERERAPEIEVPLPASLSATALARLRDDPEAFARDLARPMPRRPSASARFGTRFHAWVEARFGQQQLLDPDELPGRGDAGVDDEADLAELIRRFERGPFADRVPHAVEPSVALVLGGQVVRCRIDAVYADDPDPEVDYLVIDWKTNRTASADSLQLAVYRLAWAELMGVPPERVRAAFYYVRSGEVVEPADLPGRAELERLTSLGS